MKAAEKLVIALMYHTEILEGVLSIKHTCQYHQVHVEFSYVSPQDSARIVFRYSDEQARSTTRFTDSRNVLTPSPPTSKAGLSFQTFT